MRTIALDSSSVRAALQALRAAGPSKADVSQQVAGILAEIRTRGDAAVVDITARLDWPEASIKTLVVPEGELESAHMELDPKLAAALELSFKNCMSFHRREMTPGWEVMGFQWQRLGARHLPVERAGLYVPGGLGAYASSVIMNACPALVAGVKELYICTPPGRDGSVNKSVLAAAHLVGIRRVFRIGGAQAVAAMAYGTETVPRADVVCGPGNAYVAEAKRQVYGLVGIDNLAGPSEVLVVADKGARVDWVAADMLAQVEHGSGATAVLVAEDESVCRGVEGATAALRTRFLHERGSDSASPAFAPDAVAGESAETDESMVAFFAAPGEDFLSICEAAVETYAPEHLELQLEKARDFLPRVKSAGAVFVGGLSATAFGDYIAGSNHVLPTDGSARFSSPLSVQTFMRSSTHLEMTEKAVELLTPHLCAIADSEGFYFHRLSAQLRLEKK